MEQNSDTAVKDDPEIAAPSNDPREADATEATPVTGDVNAAAAANDTDEGQAPKSSSGRKRVPTAAALASSEQAQETAPGKSKTRQRKKAAETSVVSRTSHGGVKIGGRAVTWVGGAGMPREVLDKMGIPQLRALFLKTFNHPTGSNNAEWLRKKLAQPQDPQVGAARAAVPRARDVGAEIWTTGTTFKGFTKQERFKLQQMGGNCAAKVVEVIRDAPPPVVVDPPAPPQRAPVSRRRKKGPSSENTKMHVIGAETFELPPSKRPRSSDDAGDTHGLMFDCGPQAPVSQAHSPGQGALGGLDTCFSEGDTLSMPMASAMPAPVVHMQPWRQLRMADAHMLRTGCSVQVYRADEQWHGGVVEKIDYVGPPGDQKMMITIYYYGHDQSEERPVDEFFRGEHHSLIQWQPVAPMAQMPVGGMPMQGMQVAGGMPMSMYAMAPPGDMVTAAPQLNQGMLRLSS